jgi:hypothetical protein
MNQLTRQKLVYPQPSTLRRFSYSPIGFDLHDLRLDIQKTGDHRRIKMLSGCLANRRDRLSRVRQDKLAKDRR